MNTLSINGTTLQNIYVDASLSFNKPERVADVIAIPGRSGDLIIDGGKFNNVLITYPAYIKGNFASTWSSLINTLGQLKGYQRIVCSKDSSHFRLGRVIMPQTPNVVNGNQNGFFDLSFDCKPQRYLTTGEVIYTKTASGTVTNPTDFDAQPRLKIYGTGKITVNGTQITVGSHGQDYVIVDCEMMDCYNGTTNLNAYVSFNKNDFPTLKPGSNTITFNSGTGVTSIDIIPRWWEL